MFRLTILLLFFFLPAIRCSCFAQSPWSNIRPLLQMIDPSLAIGDCETACLGSTECNAYAFVNAKCALLGADSGKPQICVSANPTCWVRTAACDAAFTSLVHYSYNDNHYCSANYDDYDDYHDDNGIHHYDGANDDDNKCRLRGACVRYAGKQRRRLSISRDGSDEGVLPDGLHSVPSGRTDFYCKPDPTTTTTTTTTIATTTTTVTCTAQSYDAPAVCGGCLAPERDQPDKTFCLTGYDLYLLDTEAYVGDLACTDGKWLTTGGSVIADGSKLYCVPR